MSLNEALASLAKAEQNAIEQISKARVAVTGMVSGDSPLALGVSALRLAAHSAMLEIDARIEEVREIVSAVEVCMNGAAAVIAEALASLTPSAPLEVPAPSVEEPVAVAPEEQDLYDAEGIDFNDSLRRSWRTEVAAEPEQEQEEPEQDNTDDEEFDCPPYVAPDEVNTEADEAAEQVTQAANSHVEVAMSREVERALGEVRRNPSRSNRTIAHSIGVSKDTVRKARRIYDQEEQS